MDYAQVRSLQKGDRLQVFIDGNWRTGAIKGIPAGGDPSFWIQFDGESYQRRIYNGLQFMQWYWDEINKDKKFRKEQFDFGLADLTFTDPKTGEEVTFEIVGGSIDLQDFGADYKQEGESKDE